MFERSEFVEMREVWRSQTCNRGRLSLLTFFGEAKKVSGRAAMKRKVKQLRNKYKKQLIF